MSCSFIFFSDALSTTCTHHGPRSKTKSSLPRVQMLTRDNYRQLLTPPLANLLKFKGGVSWIFFEQLKFSVCEFLDSGWQSVVTLPKLRFGFIDRLASPPEYLQVFHRAAHPVSLLLYPLQFVCPMPRNGPLGFHEDCLLKLPKGLVG